MIKDGQCQEACNNEACSWDGLDCGCAPGCKFSDLASCKNECMSPVCGFGYIPGYSPCPEPYRTASIYYQLSTLNQDSDFNYTTQCASRCPLPQWIDSFSSCSPYEDCNSESCAFGFGKCRSTDICEAMSSSGLCLKCQDPLVNSAGVCQDSCSPNLRLYPSLGNQCFPRIDTSLPLLPDLIYVKADYSGDSDGSFARPYSDISVALSHIYARYTRVLLIGPVHNLKVTVSTPFLFVRYVLTSPTPYIKAMNVTIAAYSERVKLILDPDAIPTLSLAIYYSPCSDFMASGPGQLEIVNVDFVMEEVARSNSPQFILSQYFALVLRNVTFTGINGYGYLIYWEFEAPLLLENVDFYNVSCEFRIITSYDSYCYVTVSSMKYTTGKIVNVTTSRLLSFESISVDISNVDFLSNTLLESYGYSPFLLYSRLGSARLFSIRIEGNLCSSGRLIDLEYSTRIAMNGVRFRGNELTWGSDIYIQPQYSKQEAEIVNCTFEDENHFGPFIFYENLNTLYTFFIFGQYVFQGISTPRLYTPPGYLLLSSLSFRNTTADQGIIQLLRRTHIAIDNLVVFVAAGTLACSPVINITESYNVTVTNVRIERGICGNGTAGVWANTVMGGFTLKSLSFTATLLNRFPVPFVSNEDGVVLIREATNVTFIDVRVLGWTESTHGVAFIANVSTSVLIKTSSFVKNTASLGGALCFYNVSAISLEETLFESNTAKDTNGGAVFIQASTLRPMLISIIGSEFRGNRAEGSGGAVYIQWQLNAQVISLFLKNVLFEENRSNGATFSLDPKLQLESASVFQSCRFVRNAAISSAVLLLCVEVGSVQITNCEFTKNAGSGVYFQHTLEGSQAQLTLTSVEFAGNTGKGVFIFDSNLGTKLTCINIIFAGNSDSALYMQNVQGTLLNMRFINNEAGIGAGLYIHDNSELQVRNATFQGNHAQVKGGAILVTESSIFNCSLCVFGNNSAEGNGGAISVESNSALTVTESHFDSNSAGTDGSAVSMTLADPSIISSCSFTKNTAGRDGTIWLLFSTLQISNITIEENQSLGVANGVVAGVSTVTITNSVFRNQSGTDAAFLYSATSSSVAITDCRFANGSGSGILAENSSVNITRNWITNMTAKTGSAIYSRGSATVVLIDTLVSAQFNSFGSALYCLLSTVSIQSSTFFAIRGSALYAKSARVAIWNSAFTDVHSSTSSIDCVQCVSLQIDACFFNSCIGDIGAGLHIQLNTSAAIFSVTNSRFENNVANESTAIFADSVFLDINSSTFRNNSAVGKSGRGGALTLLCSDGSKSCAYRIHKNIFELNRAVVKGGAISWEQVMPALTANVYDSNSALYGSDISSFPAYLSTDSSAITEIASGQTYPGLFFIEVRDHYSQIVGTDNSVTAELSVDNGTSIYGSTKAVAVKGKILFDGFTIVATPGLNITLRVTSAQVGTVIVLNVVMRNCTLGESETEGKCFMCLRGTYCLDPSQPCRDCDSHANCYGGSTIIPKPGYWRSNRLSTKIVKCPNADACLGPPDLIGKCAKGYEGNMCQTCETDYVRSAKIICTKCPPHTSNLLKVIGVLTAAVVFCVVLVLTSIKSAYKEKAQHSLLLKILMNYFQLVMLMGAYNLNWSKLTKKLLDIQDSAGGFAEQILYFDCLIDNYNENDDFYSKLIRMALLPLGLLILSSVLWAIYACVKRSTSILKNEMVGSATILFFLVHPSVIRSMFAALNCEEVDSGEYWLLSLQLRCWLGAHTKYALTVALPSILIWGIAVPALILLFLYRHRTKLDDVSLRVKFGYLFNGYSSQKFYWEFIIIYRKLLLISIAVFLSRVSDMVQALLAFSILAVSLALQESHTPFKSRSLNVLEFRSLLVSVVTIFCGLYYLSGGLSTGADSVFFSVIIAVNVYFVQFWVRQSFGVFLVLAMQIFPALHRTFVVTGRGRIVRMGNYSQYLRVKFANIRPFHPDRKRLYLQKIYLQVDIYAE